ASAQMPSLQRPLEQSEFWTHPSPAAHEAGQLPPQSTPVSPPFCTPSSHDGAWQEPSVQTPERQSVGAPHCLPVAQEVQEPPQSVSDSSPFRIPSPQLAGAQVPPSQM